MIAKTTEGLLGANNAMNVIRTPMKVFKEARARGDRETMDRAMGYVEKTHDEAWEKKYSADEGLKQEAEENKVKAERQREELARRISENLEELENRIRESGDENAVGAVEAAEAEGAENGAAGETAEAGTSAAGTETAEIARPASVTYTRSGEVKAAEVKTEFSVSI